MEIRSRYSNRAVTYFNTAVRKCRYTLIKQSALKHNLDFGSIILSIIGWILGTVQRHNKQFSKHKWLKPSHGVSINVHRIPTKLGTEIHFNEPFKCAKFQHDWNMWLYVMANFAKCVKRSRRKNEKKPKTLATCISEMAKAIFFKFVMWTPLPGKHFSSKSGFI